MGKLIGHKIGELFFWVVGQCFGFTGMLIIAFFILLQSRGV